MPPAQSLLFTEVALIIWLNADERTGPIWYVFVAAGSLLLAANLASRPQFLVGYLLAIPIFWNHMIDSSFVRRVAAVATVAVPLMVVCAVVGLYNMARFGSPLDFGAYYNLTMFDMTTYKQSWLLAPLLLFYYFFDPPVLVPDFPFLRQAFMPTFGFQNASEPIVAGFFFLMPLAFILFSLPGRWRVIEDPTLKQLLAVLVSGSLIVVVFDFRLTGVIWRYFADFGWMLGIATIIMVALRAEQCSNVVGWSRRFAAACWACLCASCLLWFFGLLNPDINALETSLELLNPDFYYGVARVFGS